MTQYDLTQYFTEVNPEPKRGVRSVETNKIIEQLKLLQEDQTISYKELGKRVFFDVVALGNRGYLQSALRILEKEGIFFQCIRSVGYKRLSHNKAVKHIRVSHSDRLRNDTKQMNFRLDNVNISNLDETSLEVYLAAKAEARIREVISDKKTEEKVLASVRETGTKRILESIPDSNQLVRSMIEYGFTG